MSAYMVDNAHIDVLVEATSQFRLASSVMIWRTHEGRSVQIGDYSLSQLGAMLLKENARSVSHRYRDESPSWAYEYRPTGVTFTASQALMAIRGYTYQACETPEWPSSEAYWFCQALKDRVVRYAIPETPQDEWCWTDGKLEAARSARRAAYTAASSRWTSEGP